MLSDCALGQGTAGHHLQQAAELKGKLVPSNPVPGTSHTVTEIGQLLLDDDQEVLQISICIFAFWRPGSWDCG